MIGLGWIGHLFQKRAQKQMADRVAHAELMLTGARNDTLHWYNEAKRLDAVVKEQAALISGQAMRVMNLKSEISMLRAALETINKTHPELRAALANAETEGPKRDLEKANDAQAARAMSRNTKNDFREYQKGVVNVLAQFDKVMAKNSITKADLDTINDVREQMRAILRREI